MRHLFIVNPAAGNGSTLKLIPEIENFFRKNGGNYKIEITKQIGDAKDIASRYTSSENLRVYSVGGDGTLNEVLNGMVGSASSLAVIPSGTGNDFIKSIIPQYSIKNILQNTIQGTEKVLDCANVNGRYFLNISSMGFDADIAHNAVKYKKSIILPRKLAYIISIFTTLFKYKHKHMIIEIDGKTIFDSNVLLIAVANGKYYGGGVNISPHSKLEDGKLNISLVGAVKVTRILQAMLQLARGKYEEISELNFLVGKRIKIKCDNEIFMNIDGELVETNEADFEIFPSKIKFIIPSVKY